MATFISTRTRSYVLLIIAWVMASSAVFGLYVVLLRGSPVAVIPNLIELGERELNSTVNARFTIENTGSAELLLHNFATSCSCASIATENGGNFEPVKVVRVAPGERIELVAQIAVSARPGTKQLIQVMFSTNDINHKQPVVELLISRVKGGVGTSPLAVLFDDVAIGSRAKQLVKVYGNGQSGRKLKSVRSLNPDRFTVTVLPAEDVSIAQQTNEDIIGVIEITANTDRQRALDGRVEIRSEDDKKLPDFLDVFGRVVGLVSVTPETLVLPTFIAGHYVYDGTVAVCSLDNHRIEVKAVEVPQGWSISTVTESDSMNTVKVRVTRSDPIAPAPANLVIPLRINDGNKTYVVDMTIFLREKSQ